jgi:hypothetical protein
MTVYITEINKACVNYRQPNIAIETGTDEIEIDRVKHRKASAARAENGLVVYKKAGEIAKNG